MRTWIQRSGSTTGTASLAVIRDRTGDLHSIIKISDFYSARQWHSTRCGIDRPQGFEHGLMLTLPASPGPVPKPSRIMRLFFIRSPGPDFSERDRALLTLLAPHLTRPTWTPSAAVIPLPGSLPAEGPAAPAGTGHTNTQIARRLGIAEGTVRTHLENIYARLNVSNRTAAVIRAFSNPALD